MFVNADLDEIKQQLEDSMGKDEFQRQLDRQRSMSMSSSQNGDGTGSLSRQAFSISSIDNIFQSGFHHNNYFRCLGFLFCWFPTGIVRSLAWKEVEAEVVACGDEARPRMFPIPHQRPLNLRRTANLSMWKKPKLAK